MNKNFISRRYFAVHLAPYLSLVAISILIILLKPFSALRAQSVIHNERILAPEVSHFVRPNDPGVDAHGDLSLSIPLMTVPGRDGLNFDIVAYYRSGIQVKQSASWIGLGWSLDVGSITRHPMAGLDYKHFQPQIAEQVDWDYVHTTHQLSAQPDVYMANMNGSSTFLLSTTLLSVGLPYRPYEPAKSLFLQNKLRLVPAPWKPWVISTTNGVVTQDGFQTATSQDNAQSWVARSDISKIVITTEDGTRYVYSLPTLSEGYFPKENVLNFEYVRYVTTWRLVSILSPNYAGPDTVDATSTGGWVKISYRSWKTLPNYRKVDTIYNYPNLVAQFTYPWKIETPTHYAEFTISKRYDRDLTVTGFNYNKKLDKISLFKKALNPNLVTEVIFHYKPNGAPDSLDSSNPAIKSMLSKLTLDSLKIKGYDTSANKTLPAYKFSYHDTTLSWPDVSSNPTTLLNYQDDFGYFWHNTGNLNDTPSDADGRMWSLKEIVYPDGGRHAIVYENDVLSSTSLSYRKYDYPSPGQDPQFNATHTANVSGTFVRPKQGGTRVKRIKQYDGINTSGDSVTFAYGNGYHSGIPETWFRKSSELTGLPFYSSGDRGEFNVTYAWIKKTLADNSKIKSFYKTGDGPEPQMIYRRGNIATVILYGNTKWNWGEADSLQYFAAGQINPVKKEIYHWSFDDIFAFAQIAPGLAHIGGTTPPIDLNFTHKQLDSVITKHYFGSNVVTSKEVYKYNDGTLLEKKTETSGDGKVRTTKNTFIHDVAGLAVADSMKNRNMRSQIAQTRVMQNDDSTKGFSSTITTWKMVTHNDKNKFLPEKEYRWRNSATSATIPNFTWSNPDTTKWIRTQTFQEYDAHGNPKRIHDAYSSETTIYWDNATGTIIDSITTRPNTTTTLTTRYAYDPNTFRLTSTTDPNGQKTEYKYDPLQRLIQTIMPDKRIANEFAYYYSRDGNGGNFLNTDPNYVKTRSMTGAEFFEPFEYTDAPENHGWGVHYGTGLGTMAIVYDNTLQSRVLRVDVNASVPNENYAVKYPATGELNTKSKHVWVKIKSTLGNSSFRVVVVRGGLEYSLRYYFDNGTNWYDSANRYLTFYLSAAFKDGNWHAFERDLEQDFKITGLLTSYEYIKRVVAVGEYDLDQIQLQNHPVISFSYADGLGREIQTLQYDSTGAIKTGTFYDAQDRLVKVTKPFWHGNTKFVRVDSVIAYANSYYSTQHPVYYEDQATKEFDVGSYAYCETEYFPDPLNRVRHQYAPGTVFSKADTNYVKYRYGANVANEMGITNAADVFETRIFDENDVKTEIFTDTFGNKVAVRNDSSGANNDGNTSKLATAFQYDILGHLLKIAPPKAFQIANNNIPDWNSAFCTSMTYDTWGLLRTRKTPDAGADSMYYDKKENLRFVKDANGAANNYFIYYKYDNLDRKIEEGVMRLTSPTNFKPSNADLATYPSPGDTVKIKYQYDVSTYAASAPQCNLKGRLDAIEYLTDRFPAMKGYMFYSYDNNGNLEWIEQYIPKSNMNDGNGNIAAKIDYQYDALGQITKIYFHRTFPLGGASDAFYVWYDYDVRGRLQKVYTNTADVKLEPPTAQYIYWPGGQVKRLVLGSSVQGVDYLYNSRDWLTQINHQNLWHTQDPGGDGGPGSNVLNVDRFGQIIGYNKQWHIASDPDYTADFAKQFNGNISWTIHQTATNANPAGLTGWVFKYDKANRLTKGNWGYYAGSDWLASNKYDLTGFVYDRHGNLEYMTRFD